MADEERKAGREQGVTFWSYVTDTLNHLGVHGMSDEEDAKLNVSLGEEGVMVQQHVRLVLDLDWRHPSFRKLFELIDKTKGIEDLIFSQVGNARLPRHRVAKVSNRSPPKNLPRGFFRDNFFDGKEDWEVESFGTSSVAFKRYQWDSFNPSM
jgi:hypothetical protein